MGDNLDNYPLLIRNISMLNIQVYCEKYNRMFNVFLWKWFDMLLIINKNHTRCVVISKALVISGSNKTSYNSEVIGGLGSNDSEWKRSILYMKHTNKLQCVWNVTLFF